MSIFDALLLYVQDFHWGYSQDDLPLFAVLGITILVGLAYGTPPLYRWARRRRAYQMSLRHRTATVQRLLGDKITDLVEDLVLAGDLSRCEAQRYYKKLGQVINVPDLIPRNLVKATKGRLKKHRSAKNGDDKPMFIKGDTLPPQHVGRRFIFKRS